MVFRINNARFKGQSDYEVIQTVKPIEFEALARKFGIDSKMNILEVMKVISDTDRGQELFEGESNYEVIQSVEPSEFGTIARKFGIDSSLDILSIMKQISDAGKGQELVDALNSNKIKNSLWTWLS